MKIEEVEPNIACPKCNRELEYDGFVWKSDIEIENELEKIQPKNKWMRFLFRKDRSDLPLEDMIKYRKYKCPMCYRKYKVMK